MSLCICLHISILRYGMQFRCLSHSSALESLASICPTRKSTEIPALGFPSSNPGTWWLAKWQCLVINKNVQFTVGEPAPSAKHPARALFHPVHPLLKGTCVAR